jgi:Pectate lyase superfamily protein
MADKFFRRRFLQAGSFFAAGAVSASANASVNQPIKGAINVFYSFSQRPKTGGVHLFARTGNYHIWDGKRWTVSGSVANVLDYGVIGDGATDDTAAIMNLINTILARPQIQWMPIYFPAGKYIVSNSLRPVAGGNGGYGLDIIGQGQKSTIIEASVNKAVIDISGAGGSSFDYRQPGSIKNITIVNKSTGSSASVINAAHTGRLSIDSVTIICNHVGIKGDEIISASFDKVSIYPENQSLNAGRFRKGFECFSRNSNWRSCIIAGADICFDIAGDSNSFYGIDCEYSKVIFKLGSFSSLNIIGCHFESSDVLLTNASKIPFSLSDSTPWVDNKTSGSSSSGCLNLIGCICFFARSSTNVMVLKNSAAFVFTLNITGCTFTGENSLLCGTFTPNKLVAIPAGTRISITNTPNLRCAKPPSDNYSNFSNIGSSSKDEFDDVNVKQLSLGSSHKPANISSSILPTKRIPIVIDGTTYYLLAE